MVSLYLGLLKAELYPRRLSTEPWYVHAVDFEAHLNNSWQSNTGPYQQWPGSKSRPEHYELLGSKEPGTHQWNHCSRALSCWQGIPAQLTVAGASPTTLSQQGSTSSQVRGGNPQHSPLLPKLPTAALLIFKDGDQTTGTCSWKKSGILQSSMAKSSGFELSDLEG